MNEQSIRNDERYRCLFQGETPILVDGNKIIVRHWIRCDTHLIERVAEIYRTIKPQWEKERDTLIADLCKQCDESASDLRNDIKAPKLRLMFELVFIFDAAGHSNFEIVGEECPPEPKDAFMRGIALRNPRFRRALESATNRD